MSTSATYAVNLPLTNYIVGWYGTQLHDPARFLAPGVKAPGLLTSYKRYLRQDAFAVSDTRRGMYEAPRTIDIQGEDIPVMLEEHSLKIGIDDRELLGAIDQEVYRNSLRQAKTRGLARRMLISHNKEVFDYANSIIPSITKVGDTNEANKWTNLDLPLADILKKMAKKFANNNGVYPNRILTTGDIWDLIEANKQVQYKMGEGSPKVLTQDKFLDFIGLKGDDIPPVKIMRSIASYNPGGVAGAEVDNVSIVGSNFYLFYADDDPSPSDITALKTLNIAGDDMYSTVETYRDDDISTEWLRIKGHHKVVFSAPSCMMRMQIA